MIPTILFPNFFPFVPVLTPGLYASGLVIGLVISAPPSGSDALPPICVFLLDSSSFLLEVLLFDGLEVGFVAPPVPFI